MELDGGLPGMQGRALFHTHCAQCHGVAGRGEYVGGSVTAPPIAGADAAKIVRQVRTGSDRMPAFSAATISDGAVGEIAEYVQGGLARSAEEAGRFGPRALDPFVVGMIVWGALAMFVCLLALLFAEGRN